MYIAIEGVDCSGKSTQIDLLKQKFPNAIFTREPGGTDFGLKIRDIVLNNSVISNKTRFLLFLADRAEHTQKIIIESKNSNKDVISDRSFISGIAYQLANSSDNIENLLTMNMFAIDNIVPDKIIFLNISKELLTKRLDSKTLDAIESKGIEYMLCVQNSIKKALVLSKIEFLEIDASLSIEEIHTRIMEFI